MGRMRATRCYSVSYLPSIKEISIIGYITDESEGLNLITKNGVSAPIVAQGWDGLK